MAVKVAPVTAFSSPEKVNLVFPLFLALRVTPVTVFNNLSVPKLAVA